jgi:hypothetical protein
MNAHQALRHLLRTLEISLGEFDLPQKRLVPAPLVPIVWILFFHLLTKWPEGKLKAPSSFVPPPDHAFEEEQKALLDALDRFVAAVKESPEKKQFTPLVGQLPLHKWSRLHGVHMNHHFRQFDLL